jgi:hypothetical protein
VPWGLQQFPQFGSIAGNHSTYGFGDPELCYRRRNSGTGPVQYDGTYGTVVFVSDGELEQFASGYQDHSGSGRGVVVCDDDGVITNVGESDARLVFIERG